MSKNLNNEIALWLAKSTVGTPFKVDNVDHEAMAQKHDDLSTKHATIASAMGNASKSTADSRSSKFYENASKANAHAADLHAKASDAHRNGSFEGSSDATKVAMDASEIAEATNDAAQKIAEAQANGKQIVADASAMKKDAGLMFDGSADDDSSSSSSSSSSSAPDVAGDNSVSLSDLVIAAEKSADAGENYKKQSAQAYMNNDVEGAMQLSLLACDAYQTAHAYLRQAALVAGMNDGIVKSAKLSADHPLAELVNGDQDRFSADDGKIVEDSHPLAELLNK